MIDKVLYYIAMSEGTALFLKALGGILTGLLVSTGHLDASNQDTFSQDVNTIAGAIVAVISAIYLLEHAGKAALEELKWNYSPDNKTDASSVTTEPVNPTPETPAPPAA